MKRGHCKGCWWWKEYYPYYGKCYMHRTNTEQYTIKEENEFCPDYCNRRKEKGQSLDDFIKNLEK